MPVGCLNGSLALKRIAEVLAPRVLPRRSIFDMPGREPPRMNDRKMRLLREGTKIVHTSFVRNYRDLVVVVTSGKWLRVTRDTVFYYFVACLTAIAWFRFRTSGNVDLSPYSLPSFYKKYDDFLFIRILFISAYFYIYIIYCNKNAVRFWYFRN